MLLQLCRLCGINNEWCIGMGAEETFHSISQHLPGGLKKMVKKYQVARQRIKCRILNQGKRSKCSIHEVWSIHIDLIFYGTLCLELIKTVSFFTQGNMWPHTLSWLTYLFRCKNVMTHLTLLFPLTTNSSNSWAQKRYFTWSQRQSQSPTLLPTERWLLSKKLITASWSLLLKMIYLWTYA
jgi:hypothetical protein